MEEISCLKRVRDEDEPQYPREEDILKRQKSYKDIITLLEEDEDEPSDDLSSLISTLQEEITSSSEPNSVRTGSAEPDPVQYESGSEGVEEVMRHLLEASDDELGLPKNNDDNNNNDKNNGVEMDGYDEVGGHVDGGDLLFAVGEGLWEFEDHEANNNNDNYYYEYNDLLLQSEIFM
ncbi:hypothetical protein vseg_019943 [Gypsophila vaccaria]